MTESLPEVVVTVPCVEGSQHPVRLRIHDWERWEVVENPCSALLGYAFALMAPCSAYIRERGVELRREVVKALSQAGSVAVPALVQALGDSSAAVRRATCYALGRVGDAIAVPALVEALGDRNSDVRRAACVALGRLGDATAVPALVEALGDRNSDVRRASCEALVRIGSPSVPALVQALGDDDSDVRRAACEALGRLGDAQAVPALRVHAECLDAARRALEQLGGTALRLSDAVHQLLERSDWWEVLIRALPAQSVRDALVQVGQSAVPALVEALGDGDSGVRIAACGALGRLGDATAVPALIKALGDGDRDVRIAACGALGRLGDATAVPALIKALGDNFDSVRRAVCEALVQIGSPSVPALIKALGDRNRYVRRLACEALVQIGSPSVPALVQALRDEDWQVRIAAHEVLKRLGYDRERLEREYGIRL